MEQTVQWERKICIGADIRAYTSAGRGKAIAAPSAMRLEAAFRSGAVGSNAVYGAASKGLYASINHFA